MTPRPGKFRFERLVKIGEGETARVYVGVERGSADTSLVALKRGARDSMFDDEQRATLLRHARPMMRAPDDARESRLVRVREIEVRDRELQIVMDYVDGASLAILTSEEAARNSSIPSSIAVRILLDVCEGHTEIHETRDEAGAEMNLAHADVSPRNVLLGRDGIARLTEFALARAIREVGPTTKMRKLETKLGYLAPEGASAGRITRASDVFAVGVMLWESLAGKRLFRGENDAQTLDYLLRADAPPLEKRSRTLAVFDPVIARAIAKDPAARYPTARELAKAIEEAAAGSVVIAEHREVAAYAAKRASKELRSRRRSIDSALRRRGAQQTSSRGQVLLAAALMLLAVAAVVYRFFPRR